MEDESAVKVGVEDTKEKDTSRMMTSESQWRIAWFKLRRHPTGIIGLVGFAILLLLTTAAPLLAPTDPTSMDYDHLLEAPSRAFPFGTDDLGRDVLSRVLWGGRESLRVAILGMLVADVLGTVVGLIQGFYGGAVDSVIGRMMDVMLAFPTMLLLLSIVAALGPGLGTVLVALGISWIPWVSRYARGSVLAVRNCEYVTSAKLIGGTNRYIMFRHVLPNIVPTLIVYSTLHIGAAIIATAGLSYIGLGAQPPSPEWGAMLRIGRGFLRQAWWMSVFPGLAIFVAVLCINLLGDGLRDALDPKM